MKSIPTLKDIGNFHSTEDDFDIKNEISGMDNIRIRTTKAVGWNSVRSFFLQVMKGILVIVLARLLSPREFGLIAMITVITGFAMIFLDLGMSPALIQQKKVSHTQLSSVFWGNIGLGVVLTIFFIVISPFIADFYAEPDLKFLIFALSFIFLLNALYSVHLALFKRSLDFRKISLAQIQVTLFVGSGTVILAYLGLGVWALVFQLLANAFLTALAYWIMSGWRPSFTFDLGEIKRLMNFSMNFTGVKVLTYWTRKVDNLLIGKYIGSSGLGIYSKSYGVFVLPLTNIKRQIINVLFPAFSQIQDDKVKIRSATIEVIGLLAYLSFPLMTGLFLISEEFVLVVLGEKWREMIPVIKIFCLGSIAESILLTDPIFYALNKTDRYFRIALISKFIIIALIVAGLPWGIVGVAWGVVIGFFISYFLETWLVKDLIQLQFNDILKAILPAGFLTLSLLIAILLTQYFLSPYTGMLTIMIFKILVGIGVYVAMSVAIKPQPFKFLTNSIRIFLGK